MGAKSFIVRGLGNKESFDSCSHGAGRVMSRTQAKKEVTLAEHIFAGLPPEVAEREIKTAQKILSDWPDEAFAIRELPGDQGPGTILMLEAAFENVTELVSGFGKLGVSAEKLATVASNRMAGYLGSDAFAGPYLADQMLLPFAVAGGGSFTTVKPSQHSRTAADVIERFLGKSCTFALNDNGTHRVTIG